jgi:ribosomal protein S2
VDVAIPANDDSMRAIDLILNELADAVAVGKTMVSTKPELRPHPKRVRPRRPALAHASEGAEAVPASAGEERREHAPKRQAVESASPEGEIEQSPEKA